MENILSKLVKRYLFGNISDNEIRLRLYNNMDPHNYATTGDQPVIPRLKNAVKYNMREPSGHMSYDYSKSRDDIFATYLGIPEHLRHVIPGKQIVKSAEYLPTSGSNDVAYKKIDLTKEDQKLLVDSASELNIGKNKLSTALDHYFGDHTIGRGFDEKGDYVSYYDLWDINPLAGRYARKPSVTWSLTLPHVSKWTDSFGENHYHFGMYPKFFSLDLPYPKKLEQGDLSLGIGKPIEFYDRVYLDDYYDIPEEARGNPFIQEAIITADRKTKQK